jgi:hypothetical protein
LGKSVGWKAGELDRGAKEFVVRDNPGANARVEVNP